MTRRILYVDYSLGFGGSTKSLGLVLGHLPDVEKLMLTSQDPGLVQHWFSSIETIRFRRLINYRSARRVAARVQQSILRRVAMKIMALADVAVSATNTVRILRLIKTRRIDLLHLNNGFTPVEALLAARLARVPCVVHLRDFHREDERLRFLGAGQQLRVIAISDAVGRSLQGSGVAPDATFVIHDPVDVDLVAKSRVARSRVRADFSIKDDEVAVGIFGRVVEWKGQLEFVHGMIVAMQENPRIRAIIIGNESDGAPDYMERVTNAIRTSGFASRFTLAGYRQNVEDYYAAMDIVVHASITPEPFGMVVPEAMATERAVIATDAGGPREVITPGVDGVLTPPGDVAALARAVVNLASDPELRNRLGVAARITAVARFGIQVSAARTAAVYDSIGEQVSGSTNSAWRSPSFVTDHD